MTALFADTFYWVALADIADNAHQRSLALTAERAASHIVTTDEVPTEYLTFFATAPEQFRREAAESVERILASSVIRVIPRSRGSFLAGLHLYRARPDKGYSLVDCISMQSRSPKFSPTTGILNRKGSGRCFAIRKNVFPEARVGELLFPLPWPGVPRIRLRSRRKGAERS